MCTWSKGSYFRDVLRKKKFVVGVGVRIGPVDDEEKR